MADDEQLKANLELPKFFGRKKQRPAAPDSEEAPPPEPDDSPTADPAPQSETAAPAEAEKAGPAGRDERDADEQVESATEPLASASAAPEQLGDAPPAADEAETEPVPPAAEPVPVDAGSAGPDEPTRQETPEPAAASSESSTTSRMRDSAQALPLPGLPALSGYAAATVTGAAIGLLLVALTAATMKSCELIRGTDDCGRSGFFLLAAIFVLMVIGSNWLLRAWQVREPGSTALLAVGVVAVVALLFLIDVLFSWWMVILIPIVSAGAFAVSFWITDNYADEPPGDLRR